jgi:hypothetical protein
MFQEVQRPETTMMVIERTTMFQEVQRPEVTML